MWVPKFEAPKHSITLLILASLNPCMYNQSFFKVYLTCETLVKLSIKTMMSWFELTFQSFIVKHSYDKNSFLLVSRAAENFEILHAVDYRKMHFPM